MKHTGESQPLCAGAVSRETEAQLHILIDLICAWSGTLNLVARGDLPHLWGRHVADSLQLLPLLPASGTFIDLGSGAGFPGLVLAIAGRCHFHLVEADHRKAAFLRQAARCCGAAVDVHAQRVDTLALEPAALVTARAFAPLPRLLDYAKPLLAAGGTCLFLKGRTHGRELADALKRWHLRVQHWQSATSPDGVILEISELSQRG